MAKRPRSSTDSSEPVYAPRAFDFDEIDGLAGLLTMDWAIVKDDARFTTLRRVMSDPARVTEKLRDVSALALLVCEILVETGGMADADTVASILEERSGLDAAAVARFLHGFEGDGLLSPVHMIGRPDEKHFVLLGPAAELVGERVWLLSAPAVGTKVLEGAPPTDAAAVLAVAGLALHERVMHTAAGEPHRGNLKKHARRLAVDEQALGEWVESAWHAGALRTDLDRGAYVAVPSRMSAIAAGGLVNGPFAPLLSRWLAEGARPLEVIVRALARHADIRTPGALWKRQTYDARLRDVREQLGKVSGLLRQNVDGVEWIGLARASSALPDQTEGFVTPNLEVMVGPDPDPRVVARLALCAELVRIDRVLTFRLRPASVARGVAAGMSGEEMVDVLARVGRHGLPDAVRAQVLDWAANARIASAAPMTVIRVPPRLHDEVVAALGELVQLAPAPGVVLLGAGVTIEEVRLRLHKLGVQVEGRTAPAERTQAEERPSSAGAPSLPLDASPDPVLRRKLEDERSAGFAPSLASSTQRAHSAADRIDWDELRARATSAPPKVRRVLDALFRLHRACGGEVDVWLDGLRLEEQALVDPLSYMTLLVIPSSHRRRILSSGAHAKEVLADAGAVMERGWMSPEGKKLAKAVGGLGPEVLLAFLDGDAEDDEKDEPPAMSELDVRRALQLAERAELPARIWWDSSEGPSGAVAFVDELRTRGKETVVLMTEAETGHARVLPIGSVRAVLPGHG